MKFLKKISSDLLWQKEYVLKVNDTLENVEKCIVENLKAKKNVFKSRMCGYLKGNLLYINQQKLFTFGNAFSPIFWGRIENRSNFVLISSSNTFLIFSISSSRD